MVNHDIHAMNEPATKQDLYNQGILIDARFDKVEGQFVNLRTDMDARFDKVEGQFVNLRTDMDARFDKVDSRFELVNKQFEIVDIQFTNLRTDIDSQFIKIRAEISDQFGKVFTMFGTMQVEQNTPFFKLGAFLITTMIAMLGLDRWWL